MGTLRLLLAFGVLLQHVRGCEYSMTGGAASVQTFFIISGFLIAMIVDVKYCKPGQLWLFYSNRALRIYSTYWVILAGGALVEIGAHFVLHRSVFDIWELNAARLGTLGKWYLVLSNLFIFGQDAALFLSLGHHHLHWTTAFWKTTPIMPTFMLIPPAWSLSLELCFYAIAPWVLRWRTRWILALISISMMIRITLWYAGLRVDPWSYRFFPSEAGLFFAGALAYRLIYRRPQLQKPSLKVKLLQAGAYPAVALYPLYDSSHGVFFSATKLLYLAYMVVAIPMLFRTTCEMSLDRKLGELSYPLYLCHFSIVQVLNHFSSTLGVVSRVSLAIGLSCGVAFGCVVVLERPLDLFRQSRLKRAASVPAQRRAAQSSVEETESVARAGLIVSASTTETYTSNEPT